jgi:hypothetical protein
MFICRNCGHSLDEHKIIVRGSGYVKKCYAKIVRSQGVVVDCNCEDFIPVTPDEYKDFHNSHYKKKDVDKEVPIDSPFDRMEIE